MPSEKIDFEIKYFNNYIEIYPNGEIEDNSIYEIKITNLKSLKTLENVEIEDIVFTTAMTPLFCEIIDVESLLDIIEIPEKMILYNIREASKYAEYIYQYHNKNRNSYLDYDNIPFIIKNFTRYKAAKDCLLKIYMSLATSKLVEGTLGEVKFKGKETVPDLKKILDYLDLELKKWEDAIKGYEFEGRAMMKTAIKGYKYRQFGKASSEGLSDINLSMNRRGKYDKY